MANVPQGGPCEAILTSTPPALCSRRGLCLMAMPSSTTSLGPFVVKPEILFVDNTLMLRTMEGACAAQWLLKTDSIEALQRCTYYKMAPLFKDVVSLFMSHLIVTLILV
jgi:hypothetical protein